MGKTGCGKGTQSAFLAKELGYKVFSTGDRVRTVAAEDTPLGRAIKNIHTTGWVPEWLASYMLVKALLEEYLEAGLVFESVARKPEEAKKLHEIHEMLERSYVVIYLDSSDEVVKERMLKRQREGYDMVENIDKRIKAFYDETMQSIEFFTSQNKVKKIDADRPEEEIYTDILKAIEFKNG